MVAHRLYTAAHTAPELLWKGAIQHHQLLGLTVGGAPPMMEMPYPISQHILSEGGVDSQQNAVSAGHKDLSAKERLEYGPILSTRFVMSSTSQITELGISVFPWGKGDNKKKGL